MTDKNGNLIINIARTHAVLGMILAVLAIAGTVWTATKWAVRHEVQAEVRATVGGELEGIRSWVEKLQVAADIQHGTFATRDSVANLQQLGDARLAAIERQLSEVNDRLEWLVRREVERNGGRRSADTGGG